MSSHTQPLTLSATPTSSVVTQILVFFPTLAATVYFSEFLKKCFVNSVQVSQLHLVERQGTLCFFHLIWAWNQTHSTLRENVLIHEIFLD